MMEKDLRLNCAWKISFGIKGEHANLRGEDPLKTIRTGKGGKQQMVGEPSERRDV